MEGDTSVYFSHYLVAHFTFKWFLSCTQFKLHRSITTDFPSLSAHPWIYVCGSVLLITLRRCLQLDERIHDWHSNTINCVSQSKFITQRACQLRNGIISERTTKVTLITKTTHSYSAILCNAQIEYSVALIQIWACPRANTTGACVLASCLSSTHPHGSGYSANTRYISCS
jgi:hypothetical protein